MEVEQARHKGLKGGMWGSCVVPPPPSTPVAPARRPNLKSQAKDQRSLLRRGTVRTGPDLTARMGALWMWTGCP